MTSYLYQGSNIFIAGRAGIHHKAYTYHSFTINHSLFTIRNSHTE